MTYENYTSAYKTAFETLTPVIGDGDLIVGRIASRMTESEISDWNDNFKELARSSFLKSGGGQDSHMAIDYELVLSC